MKKTFALIFLFCCWLTQEVMAQETKLVHGKYVFEVSDNDDITLKDAKLNQRRVWRNGHIGCH